MASPQSTLPNDEREAQDSAHNPGEKAYQEGMGGAYSDAGLDKLENSAGDTSNNTSDDSVRDAEESGGWKSNYAGNRSKSGKGISKGNFKAIMKKRGPLAAILTLVLGGGVGAGLFFGPSLLLIQLQEQFITKFNSQDTSMTIRANKIITGKIAGDTTSGTCTTALTIACRFSKPSNKLLANLEKSGITALDKNGDPIKKTGLFQSQRPDSYKFGNESIKAKEFSKRLRTDSTLRAAFHRAYNPRVVGFTDSVFSFIAKKFGFDTKNRFAGESDSKKVKQQLKETTKGTNNATKSTLSGGSDGAAKVVVERLVATRAAAALETLSKAGKGSGVTLAAGAMCIAADAPGAITAISRAYQMRQVIAYGMAFLTTASAMKASAPDLTGESVSVLGSAMTNTVDGKSGMDSFGVKNALFGDTVAEDNSYKKFAPGAVAAGLASVAVYTSSKSVKDSCSVALNPVTGVGLNAALVGAGGASLGTTVVVAGLNFVIGYTLSEFIRINAPAIIAAAVPVITPLIQASAQEILGDITADIEGQDVGNAFASGASHVMGQTANAGGNVPLSVDQAVAYNKQTQEVQLAYAEEDRATLSPFDATSKNTFLGSMVANFLPYYGQVGSISGTLRTLINIPFLSLSTIGNTANATSDAAQYTLCDDPAIKDADVAAGPFCNIEYGIPTEYLDMEPIDIVNELVASGDIDPISGNPKTTPNTTEPSTTDYQGWLDLCTDGSTDQAGNCKVDPEVDPVAARKVALYAVYTIDHRIQKTMDGQDDETIATQGSGAGIVSPVPDGFNMTTGYGAGAYGNGNRSFHRGVDITSPTLEVRAIRDGVVVQVGDFQGNNTVGIKHSDGLISWYLHMYKKDIIVKEGDIVTAGQKIGIEGNAGQSFGTHLHFALNITQLNDPSAYSEYEIDPQGRFINPITYFKKNGVAGYE